MRLATVCPFESGKITTVNTAFGKNAAVRSVTLLQCGPVPYHFETANQPDSLNVNLITADLDAALTFTQIARQTSEREKAIRNQQNARKCYNAVLQYLGAASLARHEQIDITRKLSLLKSALLILGESF